MANDKKIEVRLPSELKDLVQRKARSQNREVSEAIRELLAAWVASDRGVRGKTSPVGRKRA